MLVFFSSDYTGKVLKSIKGQHATKACKRIIFIIFVFKKTNSGQYDLLFFGCRIYFDLYKTDYFQNEILGLSMMKSFFVRLT